MPVTACSAWRCSPDDTLRCPRMLPTRILYVEDDDEVRDGMVKLLSLEGYDITAVATAESAVSECPKCGADIYEDAVRCPLCGEYVTHSTSVWSERPAWWRVLGLAGILAVIAGIVFVAAR